MNEVVDRVVNFFSGGDLEPSPRNFVILDNDDELVGCCGMVALYMAEDIGNMTSADWDGLSIDTAVAYINHYFPDLPILYIRGFMCGWDDYVIKPPLNGFNSDYKYLSQLANPGFLEGFADGKKAFREAKNAYEGVSS